MIIVNSTLFAQICVINDEDGYTNVRKEPDYNSEIIYKLRDSEVFIYPVLADEYDSDWLRVEIKKNKYSIDLDYPNYSIKGYIHKSRLLEIDKLEKYHGNDVVFKYEIVDFTIENKYLDYKGNWITEINGRRYYGTDGGKPSNEIKTIIVKIEGKEIIIPKVLFEDLFNCNNNFEIYKNKGDYIISQWNSDGAGGYLLTWVLNTNGLKQRFIWIP